MRCFPIGSGCGLRYNSSMTVTRRVTFRLYPSLQQAAMLHCWRRLHCILYNAAVYNRKTQYQKFGHMVDYFEQQNSLPACKQVWTEYQPLGSHALQARLKRVDFAFQRCFKGLAQYPKFKSIRQYSGWTYPSLQSWKASTNRKLSNLGKMQMCGQDHTWGRPTTCSIVYRPSEDKWYACITVEFEPVRETGTGVIGIDLRCKDAVALSDGQKIGKSEFLKAGHHKLKAASKTLQDRIHVCSNPACSHVEDRDVSAAQVNERWARGLERASLDAESASSTSCGSLKQLAARQRQKLRSGEGVFFCTPPSLRAG